MSYDKNNPFHAQLVERRTLTAEGSDKETCHFVVDISGSGLTYECGDSLGVYPSNDPHLVEACLKALRLSGDEPVKMPMADESITISTALSERLCLATTSKRTLKFLREKVSNPNEQARLDELLEDKEKAEAFLESRHMIDLFEEFPSAQCEPQELVKQMRKLSPRLYSIASSPALSPNQVHLTVAIVRYEMNQRERKGVASTYLADRVPVEAPELPVFVAPSKFRLPPNDEMDIIMVGPGTGVAPFRAFLQERIHRGAAGRNWLFFGDQHRATDYLYGDEFEAWHKQGKLDELSLAFSRDQQHKVYVQHLMKERARDLWLWLREGACFYVCGDANHMAVSVDEALHRIAEEQGKMDEEEARAYIKMLKLEGRYQRDVY